MMRVFWKKGYDGTSYDDLVEGTGVSRAGLYKCFGDKRSAFMRCLDYYVNTVVRDFTAPMRELNAGLQEIRDYFSSIMNAMTKKDAYGCLAVNSVGEKITDENKDIRDKIYGMHKLLKVSFVHALKNAQKNGELAKGLNIEAKAHHLLGTAVGAATMIRGGINKEWIKNFITLSTERLTE